MLQSGSAQPVLNVVPISVGGFHDRVQLYALPRPALKLTAGRKLQFYSVEHTYSPKPGFLAFWLIS